MASIRCTMRPLCTISRPCIVKSDRAVARTVTTSPRDTASSSPMPFPEASPGPETSSVMIGPLVTNARPAAIASAQAS